MPYNLCQIIISLKWVISAAILKLVQLSFRDTFPWEIPQISSATNKTLQHWGSKALWPWSNGGILQQACTWHVLRTWKGYQKWWKRTNFRTESYHSKATSCCNVAPVLLFQKSSKLVLTVKLFAYFLRPVENIPLSSRNIGEWTAP